MSRWLAFCGPLIVLIAWSAAMFRPLPTVTTNRTGQLEAQLTDPDIVLVGNSHLGHAIDEKALAEALDLPPERVTKLWLRRSRAPVWYAMLENRVYANGHRPKLVVVVDLVRDLLSLDAQFYTGDVEFDAQLSAYEPVLDQKVLGQHPMVRRLEVRKGRVRNGVLNGVRDAAIGPIGDAEALTRVFELGAVDLSAHKRAIPVVEAKRKKQAKELSVEGSLLPDLLSLVKEHEANFVFVRVPMPGGNLRDNVDANVVNSVVESLNAAGAGYVDLTAIPIPRADAIDDAHLGPIGRERVTAALGKELTRMNAIEGPIPPSLPALAPTVVSEDPLVLSFAEGWSEERGPFSIRVAAESKKPVQVTFGDEWVSMPDRSWVDLTLHGPPPTGPWRLEISDYDKLHTVAVGRDIVRGTAIVEAPRVSLLWTRERPVKVTYASEPPKPVVRGVKGNDKLTRVIVPKLEALAEKKTGIQDCTPLRISVGGEELKVSHTYGVKRNPGRFAHVGAFALASVPLPELAEVDAWLAEDRRCRMEDLVFKARWLYPGDKVTMEPRDWRRLRDGIGRIELAGGFLGDPKGRLVVRLLRDGKPAVRRVVALQTFMDEGFAFSWDGVVTDGKVELEVTNFSRSWVQLRRVELGRW